jgi:putative addiction module antidote
MAKTPRSSKSTRQATGVAESAEPFTPAPAAKARTLKVRRIGNSLGVVLPKEVLAKLGVGEGDSLNVSETPDGVALSAFDSEVARQVEIGRGLMKRYRNALRELAK